MKNSDSTQPETAAESLDPVEEIRMLKAAIKVISYQAGHGLMTLNLEQKHERLAKIRNTCEGVGFNVLGQEM